jgi:hypothetical protein
MPINIDIKNKNCELDANIIGLMQINKDKQIKTIILTRMIDILTLSSVKNDDNRSAPITITIASRARESGLAALSLTFK